MLHKLKYIALSCSFLMFAGCADLVTINEDVEQVPDASGTIVSLRISCSGDVQPATRAPQGGAYGDGFAPANQWSTKLKGIDYDYKIQDLCLFILNTNGSSVVDFLNTAGAQTPFAGAYFVDDFNGVSTEDVNDGHTDHPIDMRYVAKINVGEISIEPFFHRVIVVANVGDITKTCKTVGDLRSVVAAQGYCPAAAGDGNIYINCTGDGRVTASSNAPSRFAMGLYEEPAMIQLHQGTFEDPHVASVTLERLSARVDFIVTQSPTVLSQQKDAFAPIPYDVKATATGDPLSRNWLTHVRLVNASDKSSYVLRRSADNAEGTNMKILGFEKADASNISTNYILDPYTANKATIPTDYFGATKLNSTYQVEFDDRERVISRDAFRSATYGYVGDASTFAYVEGDNHEYFIVGYPQENTLRRDQMTRDYATGVLCRSIFEPATIYRLNGAKDGYEVETVNLTTDVISNGTTPDGGYKSPHYGITFWMMERLVPQPTEADRLYLVADTEDDVRKLRDLLLQQSENATTGWTAPVCFQDGVAYNYYWIRHSNSQGTGHPFTPMEYSIVRNNIYSVSITSFSGPGAPSTDPAMDNPDRIQPITYVHKWHPYKVTEVGM